MADSIWPTIHAERKALAEDLTNLSAEQWNTPSLCTEWNVHEMLAHMLSAAKMTPPKFFAKFASAGFNFNKYASKEVAAESAGGPAATLAAFRAAQSRTTAPPGPKDTWLGEVFVHAEDIRRPLGIKHEYPLPWVARTLDFYVKSNVLIGSKNRVAGLTLKATDTSWSAGSGPVVEGPAMSLLVASAGRKSALDDLSGPGLETLRGR